MSTTPMQPPYPPPSSGASPQGLRTGMAVAALVLGILGLVFCPIVSVIALILGIVATVRVSNQPTLYGGKGMAIAGICLGGGGLIWALMWVPLMISILLPSLSRARELAKRAVDAANLRGIGQACQIYANANRDQLPPNFQYLLDAGLITPGQLQNPSDPDATNTRDHYFVSYGDVSAPLEDLPAHWVLAFSDPAYHNSEGANILFVNGDVEFVKEPEFTETIEAFKREFEAEFGKPPTIIEPK
jgi:competence protein ComGC